MSPTRYVLGEQFGSEADGLPPWDGTGIPLPVGDDGYPVVPDVDRTLHITEPVDGATVDPLVVIRGRGAPDGATVDLYMDSSDSGTIPVASVTAAADGTFEFAGSTPLEVSPEGIVVGVGEDRSPKVTVTVNLPEAQSAEAAQADGSGASADEEYDPSAPTVAEVQAYLADNPDQTDYVLDRERAGKARTTLIGD